LIFTAWAVQAYISEIRRNGQTATGACEIEDAVCGTELFSATLNSGSVPGCVTKLESVSMARRQRFKKRREPFLVDLLIRRKLK
jgi:hypothetical protein